MLGGEEEWKNAPRTEGEVSAATLQPSAMLAAMPISRLVRLGRQRSPGERPVQRGCTSDLPPACPRRLLLPCAAYNRWSLGVRLGLGRSRLRLQGLCACKVLSSAHRPSVLPAHPPCSPLPGLPVPHSLLQRSAGGFWWAQIWVGVHTFGFGVHKFGLACTMHIRSAPSCWPVAHWVVHGPAVHLAHAHTRTCCRKQVVMCCRCPIVCPCLCRLLQIRSADEPATLFFRCASCGCNWREG